MQEFRYSPVPQPAGGLITDSLSFFRAALTQVWPLALLAALVCVVPTSWATHGLQWTPGMQLPADAMLRGGAATLLSLLGLFIVGSALLHQMDQLARGHDAPAGASFTVAWRATPSLLLACLFLALIVVAVAVAGGLLAGVAGAALGKGGATLAVLALVVVAFVVLVRLAFMQQAIVVGGARGGAALGASWRLTRGSVLRVLAVLFLVGLVGIIWLLVAQLAAGILGSIVHAIGGEAAATLLQGAVTVGVYAAYLPLTMAAGLVLWNDLERRAAPTA